MELISAPVVSGFTTATSLIIIVSQMKSLIGISFKSNGIVGSIRKLYQNIYRMRLGDSTLGIVSIISLLMLRVSTLKTDRFIHIGRPPPNK